MSPPAKTLPICTKCFGLVSRGFSYICNKTQKRENLANFVRTSSGSTKGKVTSEALKSLCEEAGGSSRGTVTLPSVGKVQVGTIKSKLKPPLFSIDSLKRLQNSMNLSNRQTL